MHDNAKLVDRLLLCKFAWARASIAVNALACFISLKGLPADTLQRDTKRVFDLVLGTEVEDDVLSCAVEACSRLKHME